MVISKKITLQTTGNSDIVDITPQVARLVGEGSIQNGIITIFVCGSTAGVTTIEYEPGLVNDLQEIWEKLVPQSLDYKHNVRWEDYNGHSHLRATLMGASLVVPFSSKSMLLGTWQQIVVVDFDTRPRSRELVLQIMGE
ncbi:MAG: secondary thiamine-phosphate synthase enzyme YjbQ [Dehalococcoidia bacterium]|nr:secondary thiamine-phosphate synthase enzyme YjbQ [Dehalococcoidia bacterium]